MKRNKFLILLWMGIALFLSTANAYAYYLTITPPPPYGGSVTSSPAGINACSYGNPSQCSYPFLDIVPVVQLTATALPGYGVNWGGDCSGTGSAISVLMNRDKTCTANFEPCDISFIPADRTIPATGGSNFTVEVSTIPLNCSWNAYADYSWITITSGTSGSGAGLIHYTVDPNTDDRIRQGYISITQTETSFPITQEGPGSEYIQNPDNGNLYKRYDMLLNCALSPWDTFALTGKIPPPSFVCVETVYCLRLNTAFTSLLLFIET